MAMLLVWLTAFARAEVEQLITFEIPEDAAVRSFRQAAQQAGVDILVVPSVVGTERTNAVRGSFTLRQAFDQMVAGTSLTVVRDSTSGAYAVIRRTSDREAAVAATTSTPRQDETNMNARKTPSRSPAWALISLFAFGAGAGAQEQNPPGNSGEDLEEEIVTLTPFVVDAQKDTGYRATETLAGTRIRTDLADVGSSISVLTAEFLRDVGGTNNETTLAYALNTEVGGARGNFSGGVQVSSENTNELALFANPNGNTRVRGLSNADNTRNFFLNDIPWDGYTVSRVDLQRGPNAILFGLGSPAGVVNASINSAEFRNRGELGFTFDQFGSARTTIDVNRQLLKDELAVRGAVLLNRQKFRQDPAYSDDTRYFGAVSYSPKLLNQEDMRFSISGNFEKGSIDSNRPRILAPLDQISAWWLPNSQGGLNKATYDPTQVKNLTDTQSPDYLSPLGGYRSASVVHDPVAGTLGFTSPSNFKARRPDGSIIWTSGDPAAGPFPQSNYYGLVGQRNLSEWASSEGLPFSDFGGYDPATLTDPSIFDFYNKLIDGPNKGEWTDWEVFDVSLTQTFFNERLGYNLAAFQQDLDRGQWAAIGWQNRIMVDINTHTLDGNPNPNVGRAFIEEELRDTNNTGVSDRDAYRAQVFLKHNFAEGHNSFLTRLLGEHRLTGSLSEENQKTDSRSIKGQNFDTATLAKFTSNPYIETGEGFINNAFRYYLSGDLRGANSAHGLGLARMSVPFMRTKGGMTQVRYFDTTWTAPETVDPAAFWQSPDPYDVDVSNRLTQSANPANYRGWTTTEANMITFFSDQIVNGMPARDYLTSSARLSEFNVDSLTLVWQGYLWDRSVVGTYGYRKDEARSYIWETGYRAGNYRVDTQGADLDPVRYNYANPGADVRELETTTRNWSVAAHVNRLLGDHDFLPVNLSLYYNQGENFQPLAGRIDVNANPLPPPQGKTEEYSALVSTKDQKYSMRLTRYETEITNATSTGSIGSMWALEQVLGALPNSPANLLRDFRAGRVPLSAYSADETAQATLTNQIMPAWFAFEQALLERFPDYVHEWMGEDTSWGTTSDTPVTSAAPAGFSYTENSFSEGWELEFTANPLENWRIMVNASRTEASREEVPGVAFKEVADFIDEQFMTTDAGMAPIWWHGNTFGQRNLGPYPFNFRPDYLKLKALNGQSNPEVRKYRANLVTSYDFSTGKLNGAGIGGAYRWEDDAVIDYAPMKNEDGSNGINLDAPVWAKGNDSVDLWLSYRFKIGERLTWRVQLNVYNVFGENELVPVTASVDPDAIQSIGTITPDTVIPMRPSAYFIREGRSWTFSNTIEF